MSEDLLRFVRKHERLFVLTGAGLSTDSGIPAYRDRAGRWMRSQPIDARQFAADPAARRRYWARSLAGWPRVACALPNASHAALARLQAAGHVHQLVTQNVDGLHQRAGSRDVLELHGNLARVRCLACGTVSGREVLQGLLEQANPDFAPLRARPAADGDAELENADLSGFQVPACAQCGGVLKPDVVFFGDAVPVERVVRARQALQESAAVLVLGSSLMLYSGYRFCLAARDAGRPVAAVNLGITRADALLALKIERPCAQVLGELLAGLGQQESRVRAA